MGGTVKKEELETREELECVKGRSSRNRMKSLVLHVKLRVSVPSYMKSYL